jgi:TetR/AcrR family transcriptional repressor of nem operon
MEAHWETMRPHLDRIFSPTVSPLDRILAYCRGSHEIMHRQKELGGRVLGCPFCSVGSELSTMDERIRSKAVEVLNRGVRYLESAIAEGQRDGSLESGDPVRLARGVYALLSGLILQAKIYNDPDLLLGVEEHVFRLIGARASVPA